MLKAKVTRSNELEMTGRELKRLRCKARPGFSNGFSENRLAKRFGCKRIKIRCWEALKDCKFKLHPVIMQKLLDALGASSLVGDKNAK